MLLAAARLSLRHTCTHAQTHIRTDTHTHLGRAAVQGPLLQSCCAPSGYPRASRKEGNNEEEDAFEDDYEGC